MVLSDVWLWIGNLAFKYCVQKTNWKKKKQEKEKKTTYRNDNSLETTDELTRKKHWKVIKMQYEIEDEMYVTINKLFMLCGHTYIYFLLWQTVSVLVETLQATLSVCTVCESRAAGPLEIMESKYWFIEELKPSSSEFTKTGTFRWFGLVCCRKGKGTPSHSATTGLPTAPSYPSSKQLEGAWWVVGSLPLHTHCFLVPCIWRKRGIATVQDFPQSVSVTLTHITNNSSGYHLRRTCTRLLM